MQDIMYNMGGAAFWVVVMLIVLFCINKIRKNRAEIKRLEQEMDALQVEQDTLQESLTDESVAGNYEQMQKVCSRLEEIRLRQDALLEQLGHEPDEDRQMILYRELTSSGKNVCRINDRTVTLATFRQIGQMLINIYGQHDFQAISNKEHHLQLLDSLGDNGFQQKKIQMAEAYRQLAQAEQKRNVLQQALRERQEKLDFLRFKLRELDELQLKEGEEETLEQELSVLDNFEKIASIFKKYL